MKTDTIAAIATALGESRLAAVRVSGPDAITVVSRCFEPGGPRNMPIDKAPSHTIQYGWIVRHGHRIDEVLVAVMRAPRTYTREDVVEVWCHGGRYLAKAILETIIECGARLAEPGEFTKRAFLNGRIDLTQAEAIVDLIRAQTELGARIAASQLAGVLSRKLNRLRDSLLNVLAHIEAQLDFPEEDIDPAEGTRLAGMIREVLQEVKSLIATAQTGQLIRAGVKAAIVGRPNVGKSSLLNQLLGRDRAIVSPIPGTTRDTIEEIVDIHGLPVVLIDTAGLREAQDAIEAEGVRRSREAVARADLILLVLDGAEGLTEYDRELIQLTSSKPRVLVVNKIDLPRRLVLDSVDAPVVEVSCKTGQGLESLTHTVYRTVMGNDASSSQAEVMINLRHKKILERAQEAIERGLGLFESGGGLELIAMELRIAANAIGEITGHTTPEDVLNLIFSQFCIGK